MNRWWGSSKQSEEQASQRDQRAAQRELNSLDLHLSDDEFAECDTSFHNRSIFSLDGAADQDLEDSVEVAPAPAVPSTSNSADTAGSTMAMSEAEINAQKLLPFEDSSYPDDSEAWKKDLKIKFDINDVTYWFNSVESQMKKYGINCQWSKKDAILPMLPEAVIDECKPILRLTQDQAGDTIYKDLKTEILSLYGQREEDAYAKAAALTLTGKPSALGKKIIHLICPGAKPFSGCHCARTVYGMWIAKMSPVIRSHLVKMKFDKDNYKEMFDKADEVWLANGGNQPAVVAATVVAAPEAPVVNADVAGQVSATATRGQGRGGRNPGNRGNRGGRGRGGRGASGTARGGATQPVQNNTNQKPHQKGPRHPDGPPSSACSRHWSQGRSATYCSDPLVCGWVNIIQPRTTNTSN